MSYQGTITRAMDIVLDDLDEEIKSIYTRQELDAALQALKAAANTSDGPSKRRALFDIFDACGVSYHKRGSISYYQKLAEQLTKEGVVLDLSSKEGFAAMDQRLLAPIFSHYIDYLSPVDYMKMLVDRLCNPEDPWQEDTLRLRILKQCIKYGNYLYDADFGGRANIRKYVKGKIEQTVAQCVADQAAAQNSVSGAGETQDGMSEAALGAAGVDAEAAHTAVQANTTAAPETVQANADARETSEVNAAAAQANAGVPAAAEAAVKKDIEKWKKRVGKTPRDDEVLLFLDDGVFAPLAGAKKEQLNPEGTYGLLKLCDDLAGGKFRTSGATVKQLYLFAMVFGMNFYTGAEQEPVEEIYAAGGIGCGAQLQAGDEAAENGNTHAAWFGLRSGTAGGMQILDYYRDIEKNLFRDYYASNFVRFITESYSGNIAAFEADPSGRSINYKNYAEMVYLYFISHGEYTQQEKIRFSAEMIKEIKNACYKKGMPAAAAQVKPEDRTRYYRQLSGAEKNTGFLEDMFAKTPADFKQYLMEHYNCDTCVRYTKSEDGEETVTEQPISPLQLENDQATAKQEFDLLLEELDELLEQSGNSLEECKYGLYFADLTGLRANLTAQPGGSGNDSPEDTEDGLPETAPGNPVSAISENMPKDAAFGLPEKAAEESPDSVEESTWEGLPECALGGTPEKREEFLRLLEVINRYTKEFAKYAENVTEKNVTRTRMITAGYYYYNEMLSQEGLRKFKSFRELFDDFKDIMDPRLEAAHYQKISGKNIFDVLIAFSAYVYQYM